METFRPLVRENAYTADYNGAHLRTTRGTLRTRARFARKLYDRPEAFASEMPCAPAARWLAHSVRAWRQGAHVDTTFTVGKNLSQVGPINGLRTGTPPTGRE